jgi:hypothetical protein
VLGTDVGALPEANFFQDLSAASFERVLAGGGATWRLPRERQSPDWRFERRQGRQNAIQENGVPGRLFFGGGGLCLEHLAVAQLELQAAPLDAIGCEGGEPDGEMEQIAQRHQP